MSRLLEGLRRQIRVNAAGVLHEGGPRARVDLAADLLCASRGVGNPGPRELEDAEHLAHLWDDLDGDPPISAIC